MKITRVDYFLLAPLVLLSGCLSIDKPKDFLVVDRGMNQLKLITADESKLWVRQFKDRDQGNLEFWSKALRADFVENRGYTLLEEQEVKGRNDVSGNQWMFEVSTRGEAYRFLITLFVFDGLFENTIRVSEYVARKDRFDDYLEDVRRAVASVR